MYRSEDNLAKVTFRDAFAPSGHEEVKRENIQYLSTLTSDN
jgi:hypothetical protein